MPETAVTVDFKMRREHKTERREGKRQFRICVTATPKTEDVHEVKIDLYQVSRECYSPYGLGLTPYPLENGHSYTWDIETGDIVLVIVRYSSPIILPGRWQHKASGCAMATTFRAARCSKIDLSCLCRGSSQE